LVAYLENLTTYKMSDLLNSASLVMIPSGYAEDKVYSAVPTDGSGDLSFTRASNGTRVNSAGLVEVCPWNFVEQSSNLSSWSNAGVTITTGITDAFGTTNAITMSNISSGSNTDYIGKYSNAMALPTGTQINYSVYLKGSGTIGVIIERSVSGDYFYEQQGVTLSSTWTRYNFAFTIPVGVNANGISFYVSNLTGTTATSVDICFPQINYGSTAKPYFPTTDRLNVPRLTYQNGGGGCPSLLLEKQSTNLYLYSEQLNLWSTSGSPTITANDSISPDGTTNADRVQFNASGNLVYNSGTGSAGTNVLTVYAKAKSGTAQKFRFFANGATTISSDFTATEQWQRFEFSYTFSAVTAGLQGASTGASDVLFWGFQHEVSSYPTSYIPTTSASATRVADACFKTGISSLIGQTEGVMFVDVTEEAKNDGRYMFLSDASFTNRIVIYQASGAINVYCSAGSSFNISYSPPAGRLKIAFVYKSNDYALWVNGVERTAVTTVSAVPTGLSATGIGSNEGSIGTAEPLDAGVNQAALFKTRLTNAELASLTTL
jgi:hypothetical protein